MGSYFTYYLAWMLLAYALSNPWLLVGVGVFLVLRRFIPDPTALVRALSRGRALRAQVDVNPANVTARRDLALIYLDVLRPRAAVKVLDEARGRTPNDPELLYLSGLAHHRTGNHAEALPLLVKAVELDPRVRFGEPYLVAGDALTALGRHEEAEDAYERYVDASSSDVVGYVRLARALARRGEKKEAEKQLTEGSATWASLPSWRKRRAFWRGYFGLFWTRVWWLRQPSAIAFTLAFIGITAGLAHAGWPLVVASLREARAQPAWDVPASDDVGDEELSSHQ